MHTRTFLTRASLAASAVAVAACAHSLDVLGVGAVDPLFTRYVALGNSLTAGFQSGGINESTQRESYAALLAGQMHTRYAFAAFQMPGCPPPITDFRTQARLGGTTETTCLLRDPASVTATLNNVAVPDATVADPTAVNGTAASNVLTSFILGGKTQVQRAAEAQPTFVSAWVGNNDVLRPAILGLLTATSSGGTVISPGVTPQATFEARYNDMVTGLEAIQTLRGAVLIGVLQVSATPIMFPAAALLDSAFKAGFDQFAGTTTFIHPSCTPSVAANTLISFRLAAAIRDGSHPPVIACAKGAIPLAPLVGDIFVLDAAERASLNTAVINYNTYIKSVADANGWAYLDPNPVLAAQKASGCVRTVPNLASATQPFGACVSLDGVHPSARGQKVIANALIDAINAKYGTALEKVAVP